MAVESLQERSRGTLLSPPTRDEEGQPSSCPAVETATYPRTIGFRSEHGRARESILYIYIYIHIKRERERGSEGESKDNGASQVRGKRRKFRWLSEGV